MKNLILITLFLFGFFLESSIAQQFDWVKSYDITELNEVGGVSALPDGSVFVAGIHNAPTSVPYNGDMYIIKTDADGNMLWEKDLQGLIRFGDMMALGDGLIVTGQSTNKIIFNGLEYGIAGHAMFLLYINNEGMLEWAFFDSSRFGLNNHLSAMSNSTFIMSYRGEGNTGDYVSLWDVAGNELFTKQIAQSGQIIKDIACFDNRLFINGNLTSIGQVIEIDGLTIAPPVNDHGAFVLGFDQNMMANWVMIDTVINNADGQIAANANGVYAYIDLKRDGFNSEKKLFHFAFDGSLIATAIVPSFNDFSLLFPSMAVAENHVGMFVRHSTGSSLYKLLVFNQQLELIADPLIQGTSSPYAGSISGAGNDFFLSHIYSGLISFGNDLQLPGSSIKSVYLAKYDVDDMVGFQIQQDENQSLTVYPNPFANELKIKLSHPDNHIERIQLFDFSGRLVFETSGDIQEPLLQLHHLAPGVYSLKCVMNQQQSLSSIVLKK